MHIVIEGRNYEFPETLKLGEIRLIKQVAGIGMTRFMDALEDGDPDVIAALAMIVMRRAGRPVTLEQVDELDITEINFGDGEEQPGKDVAAGNGSPVTTPPSFGSPPTPTTSISRHPT